MFSNLNTNAWRPTMSAAKRLSTENGVNAKGMFAFEHQTLAIAPDYRSPAP